MFNLHFDAIAFLLFILIALGLLSHNQAITISACFLLLMQQTALSAYLPFVVKHGLPLGIIILTIGVLSPLVSGKVPLPAFKDLITQWQMFGAIIVGVAVAWLGGRGAVLMSVQPALITGLLIGTVLGVALFKGVPVGPLIAAGLLSLLIGAGK